VSSIPISREETESASVICIELGINLRSSALPSADVCVCVYPLSGETHTHRHKTADLLNRI
jgi:hypothetical protein